MYCLVVPSTVMVLVCVKLSQGPWYENTSSKLSIISPSGWVQFRVMDVGDWETAAVIVGVDGAEIKCNINVIDFTHQKQNMMRHIVLQRVTVGGPTVQLGSCVERARTVAV